MRTFYPSKDSLGFIIYRTALALKAALHRVFSENGYEITPEQWGLIRHLWEEEGLSQREIAERAAKDHPNITRMLDALEKKGIIFRQPDPRDRRKYCIYLTREGRHLHELLFPLAQSLRQKAVQNLPAQELEALKAALNKIYENLGNS